MSILDPKTMAEVAQQLIDHADDTTDAYQVFIALLWAEHGRDMCMAAAKLAAESMSARLDDLFELAKTKTTETLQ